MKRIYVAGPFRAENTYDLKANIRRAEDLGMQIAQLGATPVIPHSMYASFDRTLTDEFWLLAAQQLLEACDAIVLLPRYVDSAGSLEEFKRSTTLGLPAFFASVDYDHRIGGGELDALKEWLKHG